MDLNPKLQEWIKTEYPMMQDMKDAQELDVYDFNKFANWLCGQIDAGVMQKALEEFVQIMNWSMEEEPYERVERTYDSSYGGGHCSKHGKYYGICHSCKSEMENHYEQQQRKYDRQKNKKLEDLEYRVREMLSA